MKRKKKSSVGCLFWIALILLLVVIFLFSRSRIENVLETTGFKDMISGSKQDKTPVVVIKPEKNDKEQQTTGDTRPQTDNNTDNNSSNIPEVEIKVEPDTLPSNKNDETPAVKKKVRKSVLYFVSVDDTGNISLKPVTRSVYFDDSPLTETMKSLIGGLNASELNKGLISLIPENTVLLGVSIKDSTAFMNFNEKLKFNSFGEEGLKASLMQIVYTATEFPTVDKVQILINGKKTEYLSTEGVFVGKPLTRSSFK